MKVRHVVRFPKKMLWALMMEGVETRQMVRTFVRHGKRQLGVTAPHQKPTEEELRQAFDQLKDIPRFLPFFMIFIFPVPGFTEGYVLLAITLEKWTGSKISLLPSQFSKVFKEKDKEGRVKQKREAASG